MSEIYPHTTTETTINPPEVYLHNQSMQLHESQVLFSLEDTRAQGFNGKTVVEIVLPAPVELGSTIDKRLALIDFGKEAEIEGKAFVYRPDMQKEMPNFGVIRNRYALLTMNYHPEGLLVGIVPLCAGKSETIGRLKDNRNNYLLGLQDKNINPDLSREQATITVETSGLITIEDHSTNGTRVVLS